MAFRVASALPVDPHAKARARAQEDVVAACLRLAQPQRATEYLAALDTWRRGTGLTQIALYWAEHGAAAEAERCLAQAQEVATATAADPLQQTWRVERIRAGIVRARFALGQSEEASTIAASLEAGTAAHVLALRARTADPAGFDANLAALDALLAAEGFDAVRGALDACVELFDRFYQDPDRRAQVERRVLHAHAKLPVVLRVDLAIRLVDVALAHDDREQVARLLRIADELVAGAAWLPELGIKFKARLGALYHRALERERAQHDLSVALAMFDAGRSEITDIARAGVLRSIADAHHTRGDAAMAQRMYRQVVEAGVENPNSRPRAEDLVATCLAMAELGFEPDPVLWERMQQVERGLRDPW